MGTNLIECITYYDAMKMSWWDVLWLPLVPCLGQILTYLRCNLMPFIYQMNDLNGHWMLFISFLSMSVFL